MGVYYSGALVQIATYSGPIPTTVGGFQNQSGVLADPTTVVLKVRDGQGTVTTNTYGQSGQTYNIVKDGVGLYHALLDTTAKAGEWSCVWVGTGAVQAVGVGGFTVNEVPL